MDFALRPAGRACTLPTMSLGGVSILGSSLAFGLAPPYWSQLPCRCVCQCFPVRMQVPRAGLSLPGPWPAGSQALHVLWGALQYAAVQVWAPLDLSTALKFCEWHPGCHRRIQLWCRPRVLLAHAETCWGQCVLASPMPFAVQPRPWQVCGGDI